MLARMKTWWLVAATAMMLVGCGYQFRNPGELPAQFKQVTITSSQPYSQLVTSLKQLFKAMGISSHDAKHTQYTFDIIDTHYEHDNPNITTSNQAITLTFRLITRFQIKNRSGKVLFGPKTLVATRDVILNANQLFTNNISPVVKQQLSRRMTNLIFDQLISQQAHLALGHQ